MGQNGVANVKKSVCVRKTGKRGGTKMKDLYVRLVVVGWLMVVF